MAKSTPATLALEKAGVVFSLHEYEYDPGATRVGMQAAQALGIEPARLLKTLMARAGDIVCVLAPSDREINLKKLAAAAGAKSAAMLGAADAERITGYHVGGISPFGQKKRVAVFIDRVGAWLRAGSSATAAGGACRSSSRPPIWCACSAPRPPIFAELRCLLLRRIAQDPRLFNHQCSQGVEPKRTPIGMILQRIQ